MTRSKRLLVLAAIVAAILLGIALYLRAWGGVALIVVASAGLVWYRVQVARGEAADPFFGEAGEDTRLTAFQGGSPSELHPDRGADADGGDTRH